MAKYGGIKDPTYSAVYFPGRYWYAAMSFVYDFGGQIAKTKGGKWVGTLDSPQALQGLDRLADDGAQALAGEQDRRRGASAAGARLRQGQGRLVHRQRLGVAVLPRPEGRQPGLTGKIGAYPMPSHTKGQYMPTFLGGSVLGVPVTSKEKALAADWIAAFTSSSNMTTMAVKGGVIPNTTTLAKINASKPTLAPFAEAAKSSWFVPATPNWANVESANVLQSMLSGMLRNPGKTKELAKQASDRITQILNAS